MTTEIETATGAVKDIPEKPIVTGISINGKEAIVSLKPLPNDQSEQDEIIQKIQKASRLQVSLVAGK